MKQQNAENAFINKHVYVPLKKLIDICIWQQSDYLGISSLKKADIVIIRLL